MWTKLKAILSVICVTCVTLVAGLTAHASTITGTVKYASGQGLDGAFVSAKMTNSNYMTTIYSDGAGKFKFPDLPAGTYTIRAFARGFKDSAKPGVVVKNGAPTDLSFSLMEEKDSTARFNQATPSEWLASLPGPESDKYLISKNCSGCHHNISQIMKHRFVKADWLKLMNVMENITSANAVFRGNELSNAVRQPGTFGFWIKAPGVWKFGTADQIATYLEKVRGPDSTIPDIKFHPRPTGKAAQAVITAFRIPRYNAAPHDVQLDKNGNVWYDDFRSDDIGMLDTKTWQFKEYKIPVERPGDPGEDNMQTMPDSVDDSVWYHERWAHKIVRFDPKSHESRVYTEAGTDSIDPTGKILLGPNTRMDLETGNITQIKYKASTAGYGTAVDSKGTWYRGGIGDADIKKLNAETGEVISYKTPTPDSGPRRGCVDGDDNPWFGEWYGGKIAKLDVKAGKVIEYPESVPYGAFYEVCTDKKNGFTYGYDWHSDRLVRVNGKTGEVTEYPMPTLDNESRRTVIDNRTNPPSVWFYSMMEGLIIRVQAPF